MRALVLLTIVVCIYSIQKKLGDQRNLQVKVRDQYESYKKYQSTNANDVNQRAVGKKLFDQSSIFYQQYANLQSITKFDPCNRCRSIKYLAFKQGTNYLTAGSSSLTFTGTVSGAGPATNQLFQGIQNLDGTWSFRSASNGNYIRADSNLFTINFQTYIGPWQRFYVQRHGDHLHIESAQFYHTWWITSSSSSPPTLAQLNGGAASYIIEWYPDLKWLWN